MADRALDALAVALWWLSDLLWPHWHRFAHWLGRKSLMIRDRNEDWMKQP
jgi:hypothetical protein